MASAPTLKIWMTPLASVAMLEKFALLKIALCSASALRTAAVRRRNMSKTPLLAPLVCGCAVTALLLRRWRIATHELLPCSRAHHPRALIHCAKSLFSRFDDARNIAHEKCLSKSFLVVVVIHFERLAWRASPVAPDAALIEADRNAGWWNLPAHILQ